ncbi:MAG: alanine racemase, partial [Clostridia bacterium]|nr:alanine racemase [Clostridia bacterium]
MFNEIIIHKSNLINNIKQVKFENPNSKVCAMVKANAYGVGDIEVVQILEDYVDFWGVACFFEAQKIKTFTNKPILIV